MVWRFAGCWFLATRSAGSSPAFGQALRLAGDLALLALGRRLTWIGIIHLVYGSALLRKNSVHVTPSLPHLAGRWDVGHGMDGMEDFNGGARA